MKENTKEYLLSLLQRQTPFLVSLFFIFLEHVAINFGTATIRPMFGLACVFFWLFNRPDIFGLFSAALLGICYDFLNYAPFGSCLFAFLLLYVLENKISKYISNKLFIVNFSSFAVLSLIVISAQWLVVCIYYKEILPFLVIFITWMVTVCLYPTIACINLKIARKILPEEDFLDG